ncbi:MAG TPA: acyl-CoA dehydrogenase family protein [Solirubrobacteraceae bacterium]|jgi:isovaleryl-CoA dehydrogenase|nr:acyl-CoA dehydrogenase family protein [Solirubrobacteraceae bacterium]
MSNQVGNVLESLRRVATGDIAAAAAAVDRDRAFPAMGMEALAEAGALGLVVPGERGGAGGGLGALCDACEALGAACASTAMVYLMHAVTTATVAGGRGERAAGYLEGLAAGRLIGTLAFSERGTGAHFYAPELRATRVNGGVEISGRKSFVTSAGHADIYLVLVRGVDDEGLDCFAVERTAEGVGFDGQWRGLGMAGNSSIALDLDGVAIENAARIGVAGSADELVFSVVAPYFLVGLAAVNVGITTAALKAAVEHAAGRRYADGTSLAEVQAIQHQLADMDIAVRTAHLLVREAARLGDEGDSDALVAIMEAKVRATDTAAEVTQRALEVCGGQGYTPSLPIERHLRDARAGAVMAPTNAVLRSWIGKATLGLPVP